MNSALIRKLRREAAANPAKAGALGIGLVIALWFWIPLVIHWCAPDSTAAPNAGPDAAAVGTAAPLAAGAGSTAAAPIAPSAASEPARSGDPSPTPSNGTQYNGAQNNGTQYNGAQYSGAQTAATVTAASATSSWSELVSAIDRDPRTTPVRQISQGRDPFGPSAKEVAAELAAAKAQERKPIKRAPPHELLPADAGLVLNSTLVGSGRRMALIGGEPYWEGDVVPAPKGHESFTLVGIFPRQVVLQREGKKFGLEIKVNPRIARDDSTTNAEMDRGRNESMHQPAARSSPSHGAKTVPTANPSQSNSGARSNPRN